MSRPTIHDDELNYHSRAGMIHQSNQPLSKLDCLVHDPAIRFLSTETEQVLRRLEPAPCQACCGSATAMPEGDGRQITLHYPRLNKTSNDFRSRKSNAINRITQILKDATHGRVRWCCEAQVRFETAPRTNRV